MGMTSDPVCAEVSSPHCPSSSLLWPCPSLSVSASRWCEPPQWFSIMPKCSVYFHLKLFQIINITFSANKTYLGKLDQHKMQSREIETKFLFCYNHEFDIFIARNWGLLKWICHIVWKLVSNPSEVRKWILYNGLMALAGCAGVWESSHL